MQLCEYGCGQEAKYPFKNGKWCCSNHFTKCPFYRKKNSIQKKKEWSDLNSKFNSELCKEKKSNSMREIWENPNSIFNSTLYRKSLSDGVSEVWKDPNSSLNSNACKEKQSKNMKKAHKNPNSKFNSDLYKEERSKKMKEMWEDPNSIFNSISHREMLSNNMKQACRNPNSGLKSVKLTIKRINKKYPFFSKIEQMRYDPNNPEEIQVRCKNHNCENSKEKGGWFTSIYIQLYERIRALEKPHGMIENNFYCSQHCKDICQLYNVHGDPYKENNLPYTYIEYQTCRTVVMEREKGLCEYCGEPATDMHHIFPVKKEPFFALDPDYCIACCEKHHYEYAHEGECSTGNLAKIICSVESQKFLNQKIEDI